jgi:hypothetical protein
MVSAADAVMLTFIISYMEEHVLVLMFTGMDWCAGACAMMRQKLCWRRCAACGLLLACGVIEGRTDEGCGGEARWMDRRD